MTRFFRVARLRSPAGHVARTLAQCAVVWSATLVLGPWLVLRAEAALGVPRVAFAGQGAIAVVAFLAFTALNLSVGALLAVRGEGTPLPLEAPRRFVITGPYRVVRNPMAIAGLGMGASIALGLGSWGIGAYVLAGALFWHLLLRPAEERDLVARFGDGYRAYRRAVPLWVPTSTPHPRSILDGG